MIYEGGGNEKSANKTLNKAYITLGVKHDFQKGGEKNNF